MHAISIRYTLILISGFWFHHPISSLGRQLTSKTKHIWYHFEGKETQKQKRKPRPVQFHYPDHLEIEGLLLIFTLGGGAPSSIPGAEPYAP
jgi:hypothetical protein